MELIKEILSFISSVLALIAAILALKKEKKDSNKKER